MINFEFIDLKTVLWIRAVFRADRESRIPDPKALK